MRKRFTHRTSHLIAIIMLSGLAPSVTAGDQPITTSDLLRIRTIQSIDVAQDGSKAVFSVQSIAETSGVQGDGGSFAPPRYAYRSHLFLIDLTNRDATPVQLTHGKRRDGSPRLSPDGRTLAFVRMAEGSGDPEPEDGPRPQVWLLPLTGGEARELTAFESGASSPVWSPIGDSILVTSSIPAEAIDGNPPWDNERPNREWNDTEPANGSVITPRPDGTREEIRAWLAANAAQQNPTMTNRLSFQGEQSLRGPDSFAHLFVVNAMATEAQASTDAVQLTGGFFNHTQAHFMPTGEAVVYAAQKSDGTHPDRLFGSDLWLVNADGTDDRLLLSSDEWGFSSPRPSLDGSIIAFTSSRLDEPTYRQRRIGMVSTTGAPDSDPLWLTDTLDRSVRSFEWMSARGAILFNTADRGSVPLMTISPGLLEPAMVVDGALGVTSFDVGGGAVVYARTNPANPSVLMVRTPRDGEWQSYDPNPWVHDKAIAIPSEAWLDRPDGTRIQYWIMQPTNRVEGKTYPLVLNIHGGPSAMWGPGEASMWLEFQLMCSWGYGVVYCNQRGSGGYGYDFQKANHQDWGSGPGGDVLGAVDRMLSEDWVDPDRLVVTGGSYAGYLTAWLIGHDHRFKAAVAQRGVYDLATFFGEGNAWRLVEWAMGGRPWESNIRPILHRESPITHVRAMQTPLLIMHSSNDLRTGVSQSEMLYRSLKVLKRPVEYVRYPNAGHDLSRSGDPTQRMDRLNRIIEFFERHITNDRDAPQTVVEASADE